MEASQSAPNVLASAASAARTSTKVVKLKRQTSRSVAKKKATAANRLTTGKASVERDVGGNTQKSLSALETLVAGDAPGDMNTAEGSMRLQAMMGGEESRAARPPVRRASGTSKSARTFAFDVREEPRSTNAPRRATAQVRRRQTVEERLQGRAPGREPNVAVLQGRVFMRSVERACS